MAVVTTCDNCNKTFSAQNDYLGKKVKCPGCGTKVMVLSEKEREEELVRRRQEQSWREEQEKRIELLESLGRAKRRSLAVDYGTGLDPVRFYNPGAVTRFRKLRALSRFLLLAAYLLMALIIAGAGITVYLYREGTVQEAGVLALLLLGWLMLLVFLFCLFKFLGELAWLIADVGDHQLDMRNLLLDLRDDLARILTQGPEG